MGRTISSFRMATVEEQKEWKSFRQDLDKIDRKMFDQMFSIAHLYNSACSYAAKPIRIHPIFMSIRVASSQFLQTYERKSVEEEEEGGLSSVNILSPLSP